MTTTMMILNSKVNATIVKLTHHGFHGTIYTYGKLDRQHNKATNKGAKSKKTVQKLSEKTNNKNITVEGQLCNEPWSNELFLVALSMGALPQELGT